MAKKKITRKELVKGPDEFITLTGKVIQWSRENTKPLIYGVSGFFLLVILVTGYSMHRESRRQAAAALLSQIVNTYQAAENSQDDSVKALAAVKPDLERLVSRYGSLSEGRLGRILYGHLDLAGNAPDDAAGMYGAALDDFKNDPTLTNTILNGLATASMEKGDNKAAIGYFEKIADGSSRMLKDAALFHLGHLYRIEGESEKSHAAYERLGTDFPDSMFADMAREKLAG